MMRLAAPIPSDAAVSPIAISGRPAKVAAAAPPPAMRFPIVNDRCVTLLPIFGALATLWSVLWGNCGIRFEALYHGTINCQFNLTVDRSACDGIGRVNVIDSKVERPSTLVCNLY